MPGPPPKRSSQRRRRNKPDRPTTKGKSGSRSARPGEPPRSGKGSGTDAWREYAKSLGLEIPADASRAQIMTLVDEGPRDVQAEGWHPIVRDWYQSLDRSGQSHFYEPSDWQLARIIAESMSRELSPQPMVVGRGDDAHIEMVRLPPKGASVAAWLKAMSSLLVTEGDRRRLRLELDREAAAQDEEPVADVADLDGFRRRKGSV